ncbi:MAG TPA: molybdenum cofactor guanylyltransferase [Vicinamibacterales bacterium]|nr:molybdenum cofactor guanylyltransferase [Vicinamibacterales bacterium]
MKSAAILAGGRATRFGGRDKSALLVDGRSILERQVAELSTVVDDLMIVASGDGARGPADGDRARGIQPVDVAQRLQPTARSITDIIPGCGPLGALHAALTEMRSDRVLVVACDMPYVEAALADFLLSIADDAAIVVPETDRGYHPLCAVYTRACLEPVAARLAERRLMMRDLFDDVPTRIVTAEELSRFGAPSRLLANVNTPAEYARLEALQGHKL